MARVLVVEDDPAVRQVAELSLDGHDVLFAADGAEALDVLAGADVDVVVLDVMMPRLDGIETLRRIRADDRLKDLPVIMLTARVGEDDHLRAFQEGADGYLTKPFDPDDLAGAVAAVKEQTPEERARHREAETTKAALLRQVERRFR